MINLNAVAFQHKWMSINNIKIRGTSGNWTLTPCFLYIFPFRYLINFLLDATLGMLLIYAGIRAVSSIVEWQQWESLRFGEYGKYFCCCTKILSKTEFWHISANSSLTFKSLHSCYNGYCRIPLVSSTLYLGMQILCCKVYQVFKHLVRLGTTAWFCCC